jgi:hypothetical protein
MGEVGLDAEPTTPARLGAPPSRWMGAAGRSLGIDPRTRITAQKCSRIRSVMGSSIAAMPFRNDSCVDTWGSRTSTLGLLRKVLQRSWWRTTRASGSKCHRASCTRTASAKASTFDSASVRGTVTQRALHPGGAHSQRRAGEAMNLTSSTGSGLPQARHGHARGSVLRLGCPSGGWL